MLEIKGSGYKVLIENNGNSLTVNGGNFGELEIKSAPLFYMRMKRIFDGKIEKTLDRGSLVAVQTPQGVKVKPYLDAINNAEDISIFTDDTSIMEWAGFTAYTVEGDYKNIKITTTEDIALAEIYLKGQ